MTWMLWHGNVRADLALLALAMALDLTLPELPAALHPVRWMGVTIDFLQRHAPMRGRTAPFVAGLAIALAVPLLFAGLATLAASGLLALGQAAYVIGGAVLLKSVFAVRGLIRAGLETAERLASGDLTAARKSLRNLVSRDPSGLSPGLVAGAAVESVAENSTDSFLAPWLAYALLGLPGAFAYRAVNTLDSMIGYRGKYEYLGRASARIDDAANLVPARGGAAIILAGGGILGLPARRGWRIMQRDKHLTASLNAGWTMAAMSGLLGVRLEKTGHYVLGSELSEPEVHQIRQATRVVMVAAVLGLMVSAAVLTGRHAFVG